MRLNQLTWTLLIASAAGTLLAACSSTPTTPVATPGLLEASHQLSGPRRTVTVAKFDALDAFKAAHGEWDVGGGLSAMLTTALVESGQFIVLERADIAQVFAEQELKGSGLVNAESGPAVGNLTGAQFLVMGSVTEYGANEKGGGFSFGLSGLPGMGRDTSVGASPTFSKGYVGLDVRVVDAETGEVVASFAVRQKIKKKGFGLSLGVKDMTFGGSKFSKTPIGKATRSAIQQAAGRFAAEVANQPWRGKVVDSDGDVTYLNAGENAGIEAGDRFEVCRITKTLRDPETGLTLGQRRESLGTIVVTDVEEKVSIGRFEPTSEAVDAPTPARGDLVLSR